MQRSCRATPRRARTGAHAGLSLSSNVPELWSVPFTHASLSPARAYATPCTSAVVIGVPVLSSMFTPAAVKTFMGLLLMVRPTHAPYDAPPLR